MQMISRTFIGIRMMNLCSHPALIKVPFIVSLSFGAARDFGLRKKLSVDPKLSHTIKLCDGDLLAMTGHFQTYYQHRVYPEGGSSDNNQSSPSVSGPKIRYNLTWRTLKSHLQHCERAI